MTHKAEAEGPQDLTDSAALFFDTILGPLERYPFNLSQMQISQSKFLGEW